MWAMANMRQQYNDEEKRAVSKDLTQLQKQMVIHGTFDISTFNVNNVMGFMLLFWKR